MKTKQVIVLLYVSVIFLVSILLFLSIHWLLGIGAWLFVMGISLSSFVIFVPEITGWVTHNKFSGKVIGYKPGCHIKYPWEKITDSVSLKMRSGSFSETYNSKDGIDMLVKFSYGYEPSEDNLQTFIQTDESIIETEIMILISGILSNIISSYSADYNQTNRNKINEYLVKIFKITKAQNRQIQRGGKPGVKNKNIKSAFGINMKMFHVESMKYSEPYKRAKAAESANSRKINNIYEILEIDPSASNKDVKKAYRRMANKYHPDKVSYLGEDFQKIAHQKLQEINEAYEKIKKERNLN